MSRFANIVHVERNNSLKKGRTWMFIVGALTLLFQGFLFGNSRNEMDGVYDKELHKYATSLAEVRSRPPEARAEFDENYDQGLARVRLIYGAGIVMGVAFVVCGFLMLKKPVVCSITALTLYLGSIAAMAVISPVTLVQGVIFKVLCVTGLISALKAALASEREKREAAFATSAAPDLPVV